MHGFRCLKSVQIGMLLFLVNRVPVNFGISSCFDAAKPYTMRTVSSCGTWILERVLDFGTQRVGNRCNLCFLAL